MEDFKIKIDLAKLNGAVKDLEENGVTTRCVCIPIENNPFFISENHAIYLDLTAKANNEVRYNNTHFIKPYFNRDRWATLPESVKARTPIIGHLSPFSLLKDPQP